MGFRTYHSGSEQEDYRGSLPCSPISSQVSLSLSKGLRFWVQGGVRFGESLNRRCAPVVRNMDLSIMAVPQSKSVTEAVGSNSQSFRNLCFISSRAGNCRPPVSIHPPISPLRSYLELQLYPTSPWAAKSI